jgi:imidazolonepropionase-like amidohydrolase
VRDRDVDNEFIAMLHQRPDVFFLVTLWGERNALYDGPPGWIDESIVKETLSAAQIQELRDAFATAAASATRARAREDAERLLRNVAALHNAGVRIGVGTDTGGVTGGGYFGIANHVELELLVKAGLSPAQAIAAGTRNSADILGLRQLGTVAPGKSADFIVLDANPLDAIGNTRRISTVYSAGVAVDRAALKSEFVTRAQPENPRRRDRVR